MAKSDRNAIHTDYAYRPELRIHSGGLVNSEIPETLGYDQSPNLLNVRPLGRGRYGMRNGIEMLGNATAGSGALQSLYTFKKGTTEILTRTYAQKIQYLNSATWTDVPGLGAITVTTNLKFGFANDRTYMYLGNGVDDFMYWDGTASNIVQSNSLGKPKGNIYEFYLNRLCVAGDVANPATLYYSKTGNALDFTFGSPRVADDGGSLLIGNGGDPITSLKSLILAEGTSALIVFKKSSRIYSVTFSAEGLPAIKELKKYTGAVNDRTTLYFGNDLMYVEENNNIQMLGIKEGVETILSKQQASNDLDEATPDLDFSNACAFYFNRKKFAIFTAASFGSTTNDVSFVYFEKYQSWWKWSGINANQYAEYNKRLVWASSIDLNVYQMNDAFDDLGNSILSYRDTKDIDLADLKDSPMGIGFRYKQCRYWFIEGFMSANSVLRFKTIYDANEDNSAETVITGTDDVVDEQIALVLGRKVFGFDAFGGSAESPSNFPMQHFVARISIDAFSFQKIRLRIEQSEVGAPYVITKICPWIGVQPDDMFPDSRKI